MEVMNPNADYGNWVPAKMLRASGILSAAGFTCCAAGAFTGNAALAIPCIAIGTAGLCFTVYMKKCSNLFDFKKGGMMGKMHEYRQTHHIVDIARLWKFQRNRPVGRPRFAAQR